MVTRTQLLNDFIRSQEERFRNSQTKGPCGLEIDAQLVLRGLFDGEIGGLSALEHLAHESGSFSVEVGHVGAIGEQAAAPDEWSGGGDGRKAVVEGQPGYLLSVCDEHRVGKDGDSLHS